MTAMSAVIVGVVKPRVRDPKFPPLRLDHAKTEDLWSFVIDIDRAGSVQFVPWA